MTLLAKTLAGSKLFCLDGPNSDTDIKGIFLPSLRDCLLNRAAETQSQKTEDTEYEAFSLTRFLELAARAEDVAIIMMHAPADKVIESSPTFDYLRANRKRFYTKHMTVQLGYCKSQLCKYALRADRMATVEKVIEILTSIEGRGVARLSQAWDEMVELPHAHLFENALDRGLDKRVWEVCGKMLPATISPTYARDIMTKLRASYGERVVAAKNLDGHDRKAVSHSFRVGYQLKHIFIDGDFSFPLPETAFIRSVKEGTLNYVNDGLDKRLDELIAEVEELSAKSTYPESVDRGWLDGIILDAYNQV